jgi:exopolyphosphatase/guanosine-5'-triphosphate,3'-diphosphate pyrophosphatase
VRIAAVGLGGNSFRCVVADVSGEDEMVRVLDRHELLHLAGAVARTGCLGTAETDAARAVLERLCRAARRAGAKSAVVVATSPFRDAIDGAEAVDRLSTAIGHPIELLDAGTEAELAHRGALWGFSGIGELTTVDLGGGSLMVTSTDARGEVDFGLGLPLGIDRTLALYAGDGALKRCERVRIDAHVAAVFDRYRDSVGVLAGRPTVLLGGTARAIASVVLARRHGVAPQAVHGEHVAWGDLTRIIDSITGVSPDTISHMASIPRERAQQMPVGATIFRQVLRALGTRHAMVGETGLLEAVLLRAAAAARSRSLSSAA